MVPIILWRDGYKYDAGLTQMQRSSLSLGMLLDTFAKKVYICSCNFATQQWSSSNSTSKSRLASNATSSSYAADTKRGKVRSCWSKWWCWWYGCLLRLTLATIACKNHFWRKLFVSKRTLNIVNRLTKYCVWLCDANDWPVCFLYSVSHNNNGKVIQATSASLCKGCCQ